MECVVPGTVARSTVALEVALAITPTMVLENALPYEMRVLLWQVAAGPLPAPETRAGAAPADSPQGFNVPLTDETQTQVSQRGLGQASYQLRRCGSCGGAQRAAGLHLETGRALQLLGRSNAAQYAARNAAQRSATEPAACLPAAGRPQPASGVDFRAAEPARGGALAPRPGQVLRICHQARGLSGAKERWV